MLNGSGFLHLLPYSECALYYIELKDLKRPCIYLGQLQSAWLGSVCSVKGCKEKYRFLPYQHLLSHCLIYLLFLGKLGG